MRADDLRCQAEQRPPLRAAENTGNGAAPRHFDSLRLAPIAADANEGVLVEGCDPHSPVAIEANAVRTFHGSEATAKFLDPILTSALAELSQLTPKQIVDQRYQKFRIMGQFFS